jgi:hypothetical protein
MAAQTEEVNNISQLMSHLATGLAGLSCSLARARLSLACLGSAVVLHQCVSLLSSSAHAGEEFVLDWVLERKGVSDLTNSIQDDRYKSQKVKMQISGLRLPVYLVEGDLSLETAKGPRTALFETEICAGAPVLSALQ